MAGAVGGERLPFCGFELAAVLGQLRGGDAAVAAKAGQFGAQPTSAHRLGLVGIAQAPQSR